MVLNQSVPTDFDDFLREFQRESDRAAAVLGAAYADARLEDLLRAKFAGLSGFVEDLLSGQGGLANFSARISVAYAVGLISLDVATDLHLVRKIRNEFAHKPHGLSFATPSVTQRVDELRILKVMRDEKGKPVFVDLESRKKFNLAVAVLVYTGIVAQMGKVAKFAEAENPSPKMS